MLKPVRPVATGRKRWAQPKAMLLAAVAIAICLAIVVGMLWRRPNLNPAGIRLQAQQDAQTGRWVAALEQLKRLDRPDDSDRLLLAVASYNTNKLDDALEALRAISPTGKLAAQASFWRARISLSRFLAVPMEQSLLEALKLDPKLAEARRLLVYLYGTQDRRADLLKQFESLAETARLTFDLINHWCISHNDMINDPEKLKSDLEKFVAADPEDRRSRMALAMNERKLTHYEKAWKLLEPLPDADPDALACRAEIAFDRGEYDKAERMLTNAPKDRPQLERLRGRLASRRGDRLEALAHFRASDALEPNQWETIYGLAQSLPPGEPETLELQSRRTAQRGLEEMLTTIEQQKGTKVQLCQELAALCETGAYFPEARAWYRLAISLDPLNRTAQQALMRLNLKRQAEPASKSP